MHSAPDPTPATDAAAPAIDTPAVESETTPVAAPAAAPTAPDLSPAACGARLAELFPALFALPVPPAAVKPLKLRIQADIQQRAPDIFSKRVLGIFFSRYTTSNPYLKALVNAASRFDLDGQPAGDIAAEHRQAASEELARRHAVAAERRAAQRPAPRRDLPPPESGSPQDATHRAERADGTSPALRPPRESRPPHPRPQWQARHHERPQRPDRPLRADSPPRPPAAVDPAATPADPAQRERAALLRSYEASTLSKANFCALKGLDEAALDAALAQARKDQAARA